MASKTDDEIYSQANEARSLINNEHLSDVGFLVGDPNGDRKLIYAHKLFLMMGSPVFEAMFIGSLPEKKDIIEVPDLTPTGFLNMIRFIYGERMNFEMDEFYETHAAGQKYLVRSITHAINDRLKEVLNGENMILCFDQLLKIRTIDETKDELINNARQLISMASSFSSIFFNKISKETLIDILSAKSLNVKELDIIKLCINWTNENESTDEDKRTTFKSIVPYIKFSEITIDDLKEIKEFHPFFTDDEIGKLFVFLADKKRPYPFDIKTKRMKRK